MKIMTFIWVKLTIHCLKNDTDLAHYNFNAHQPILVFFVADEYSIK